MVSTIKEVAIAHQIALRVFQDALIVFAVWADHTKLPHQPIEIAVSGMDAIATAKELLKWPADDAPNSRRIGSLRVVFDAIHLQNGASAEHFWPAWAIENTEIPDDALKQYPKIPYPSQQQPSEDQLAALKQKVSTALKKLSSDDWMQLPLLMLFLEKYGSYLSLDKPDIALFDQVKTLSAVAASLGDAPDKDQLCLIAGDLSGIQDFIYTISSDGALKSLRARSFTLELVTEEIVQQLLTRLSLSRANVIYAGGGNLYLLAPASETVASQVEQVRTSFNDWLLEEYQSKVFLALDSSLFRREDISTLEFAKCWQQTNQKLANQKNRKFDRQMEQLLKERAAHEPCKVCHRDDTIDLKPLDGKDGVGACLTCRSMFNLGQQLFKVKTLVRTSYKNVEGTLRNPHNPDDPGYIEIKINTGSIYYHLFDKSKPIVPENEGIYLINTWDVDLYKFSQFESPNPLLLGNYYETINDEEHPGFLTAQEMANRSVGAKRVGYLRMDVDKLGQIFATGLGKSYTLPKLAGLSRQMSYFFKVYLNSLAQFRQRDFLSHANAQHQPFESLTKLPRQDLLFIYAGGDDLFVSGAWDQVVEFAFDVYQSFRAFTGWHPDITLSAGISLSGPKYPLYQSARDSGDAEGAAKSHGRDSLGLFEQVFKWQEWLGTADTSVLGAEIQEYLQEEIRPEWLGIFPFVSYLRNVLETVHSQSFVKNLLSTAQLQDQRIEKLKQEKKKAERKQLDAKALSSENDLRYFLHLPRVAYILARLSIAVKKSEKFDVVRMSLKSPYNAPYFRAIATWLDLLNRNSSNQ